MTVKQIPIAYYSRFAEMDYWQKPLAELMPEIRLVQLESDAAGAAEIIMCWEPPEGAIAQLKNLKGIISLAQGVDHILKDPTLPGHLKMARLVDPAMSRAMAEWVLLAILEHFRERDFYRARQMACDWLAEDPVVKMASDTTVAVMGLGAIGSFVAMRIANLDFRTIGWSRSAKSIPGVETRTGADGFTRCLNEADYLVSILPLTDETRDIYDKNAFAMMKDTAVFINAGRGLQVVEDDLMAALDAGTIANAVLDVTRTEPLPPDSPLWRNKKITIWPHVSAPTNPVSAAAQITAAIKAMLAGHDPENPVDIKRGY